MNIEWKCYHWKKVPAADATGYQLLLDFVNRNPGKTGPEIPRGLRKHLREVEKDGLIIWRDGGWHLNGTLES